MSHSNITIICFFLLLNLVVFPFAAAVGEAQFPCFFIFGDSMVDNGNNNYLHTAAKVNYLPYGIDFPAGPTGRFTNGRNAADVIAQLLGFDKSIPPFANATNEDILGGVNYGSGGAGILDDSGSVFGDVVSMNEQLTNHEVAISRLAALLGSKSAAKKHLKSCLYYVGMGNNDYLGNYLPKYYASTTQYTPKQFATVAIKQYAKQLRRLYYNGARKVAVIAPGKLGCVPQQLSTYGATEGSICVETSNDIVQIFNEKLELLINDLNKRLPNANFLYTADVPDQGAYANMTNLTEPCCPVSTESLGHCVVGSIPCSNRDEYYFWDSYHPTEAAVLLSANIVHNAMSPFFTKLLDVL
ncbi:hypothetical protein C2S53_016373 [Perilla frutescens var. hirtella]|uniref:Uncharacterized protein n=1 Tax=Perilla frutescens var. hirtella TaxID=608512 RepID=A0AAD4P4B7_PERFH|nr:hypothetical protein C2S53_016373 [Perilla frutescens var. hirtella]